MLSLLVCLLCALVGLFAAPAARATTLYNQSPPNSNQFDIVDSRLADDFKLAQPVLLTGINFWYEANFQSDLSTIAYAIYDNSGGALGTEVAQGTASPTTSDVSDLFTLFFASFTVPNISLGAGTYWLELHGGSSLIDNNGGLIIWWEAADDNTTHIALSSTSLGTPDTLVNVSGFDQYAFQLTGTAVPEPETLALLGSAFIALGLSRRWRST